VAPGAGGSGGEDAGGEDGGEEGTAGGAVHEGNPFWKPGR
jgi:hypothetical protein